MRTVLFALSFLTTMNTVVWAVQENPLPNTPVAPPVGKWTQLCESQSSTHLDVLIEQVSEEFQIPPALLGAVVTKESFCDPDAIGGVGEIGLAQIHPGVWTETLQNLHLIQDPSDLLDPLTNLRCSAYILSGHLGRTDGDVWRALRRYNGSGYGAAVYADDATALFMELSQ